MVSNAMIAIIAAYTLNYFILYKSNIILWRFTGGILLIILGIAVGLIEDTAPMLVLMWTSILIGLLKTFHELIELIYS